LRDAVAVFTLRGDASLSGSASARSRALRHGAPRKVMSPVSRREPELA